MILANGGSGKPVGSPADIELVVEAARAAGLPAEQVEEIRRQYVERITSAREAKARVRVCGNVSKEVLPSGYRPVCGREPHTDVPGDRTPHAVRMDDGQVVTWFSPLTIGEQADAERAGGRPACGAESEPLDGHVMGCRRGVHGPDAPHLGQHPEHGPTSW